jgi:hypothetical protein
MEMTIEEYAKEYVDTILSQADGLGQYVHPTLGISDSIMLNMIKKFGDDETQEAIKTELNNRIN